MTGNEYPIFVTLRDRLSPLLLLLDWLESAGYSNIFLIDNASTYPPLCRFLERCRYNVCYTGKNLGHRAPWLSGMVQREARESYYVVTDPDVVPSEHCPTDVCSFLERILISNTDVEKVGLGLCIDDLPNCYRFRESVIQWEKKFWINEREPGVYEADVDTTFALYRPYGKVLRHFPCLRTGYPYVARHLPWYEDSDSPSEEVIYYRKHASNCVSNWDKEHLSAWKTYSLSMSDGMDD